MSTTSPFPAGFGTGTIKQILKRPVAAEQTSMIAPVTVPATDRAVHYVVMYRSESTLTYVPSCGDPHPPWVIIARPMAVYESETEARRIATAYPYVFADTGRKLFGPMQTANPIPAMLHDEDDDLLGWGYLFTARLQGAKGMARIWVQKVENPKEPVGDCPLAKMLRNSWYFHHHA